MKPTWNALFLAWVLWMPVNSLAQAWDGFYLSGPGSESIDYFIALPDGGALALLSYDASWEIEKNVFLPYLGRRDLAIVRWDKDKRIVWKQFAIGPDLDENKGLVLGNDGTVYWAGNCWDGLIGEDWVLTGQPGLRSIFLIKLNMDGEVLRTQLWGGNNLKSVEALVLTDQEELVLSGYFRSQLWVGADTLTAMGNTDAFVIGCDTAFQQLWTYQAGAEKDCRALHLAPLPGGQVAVSGYFDGKTIIGSDTLSASSNDEDVWLALLDPRWGFSKAWRAGGVLNSRPESMTYVSNTRQIAITGTFSGVMQVRGATPSIQSNGLASNGFVWLFSTIDQSQKLLNYGTTALEALRTVIGIGDTLYVVGYYEGATRIGTLDLPGLPAQGQGFLMALDSTGALVEVLPIGVSDRIIPTQLVQFQGSFALVGSYRGTLIASPSKGSDGFDGFILMAGTSVSSLHPSSLSESVRLVQPCPALCQILEAPETLTSWILYDLSGNKLKVLAPEKTIDLSQIPDGNYLLAWKTEKLNTLNGLKIISKISY